VFGFVGLLASSDLRESPGRFAGLYCRFFSYFGDLGLDAIFQYWLWWGYDELKSSPGTYFTLRDAWGHFIWRASSMRRHKTRLWWLGNVSWTVTVLEAENAVYFGNFLSLSLYVLSRFHFQLYV
jgi:hypothetical protein